MTYSLVQEFSSKTRPGKVYQVKRDENGNLSCNCPAWTFKVGNVRICRHIMYVTTQMQPEQFRYSQTQAAEIQILSSERRLVLD